MKLKKLVVSNHILRSMYYNWRWLTFCVIKSSYNDVETWWLNDMFHLYVCEPTTIKTMRMKKVSAWGKPYLYDGWHTLKRDMVSVCSKCKLEVWQSGLWANYKWEKFPSVVESRAS
jgi:hypothetical protein